MQSWGTSLPRCRQPGVNKMLNYAWSDLAILLLYDSPYSRVSRYLQQNACIKLQIFPNAHLGQKDA